MRFGFASSVLGLLFSDLQDLCFGQQQKRERILQPNEKLANVEKQNHRHRKLLITKRKKSEIHTNTQQQQIEQPVAHATKNDGIENDERDAMNNVADVGILTENLSDDTRELWGRRGRRDNKGSIGKKGTGRVGKKGGFNRNGKKGGSHGKGSNSGGRRSHRRGKGRRRPNNGRNGKGLGGGGYEPVHSFGNRPSGLRYNKKPRPLPIPTYLPTIAPTPVPSYVSLPPPFPTTSPFPTQYPSLSPTTTAFPTGTALGECIFVPLPDYGLDPYLCGYPNYPSFGSWYSLNSPDDIVSCDCNVCIYDASDFPPNDVAICCAWVCIQTNCGLGSKQDGCLGYNFPTDFQ